MSIRCFVDPAPGRPPVSRRREYCQIRRRPTGDGPRDEYLRKSVSSGDETSLKQDNFNKIVPSIINSIHEVFHNPLKPIFESFHEHRKRKKMSL